MNKIMWPGILFVMIGASVIVHVIMLVVVTTDTTFAVDNRYRAKADPWWAMVDDAKTSGTTQWTATLDMQPSESIAGVMHLTLRIVDPQQHTVDNATAQMRLFHRAQAGEVLEADLQPTGDRTYTAMIPMTRDGWWKATILATRDHEQYAETFDLLVGR